MRTHKDKEGLTLIEMVVVIGIIAALTAMVIGLGSHFDNQAKERGLKSMFAVLDGALQEYHEYRGSFPDPNLSPYPTHSAALYGQLYATPDSRKALEGINEALIRKTPDKADMPQIYDPWGTVLEYFYTPGDNFPKLVSAGPDKILGTGDDISSGKTN